MTQARDHDERGALAAYLESVSAVEPLSREQEIELFRVLTETECALRATVLAGSWGIHRLLGLGRELARGTLRAADVSAQAGAADFDEHAERDRLLARIDGARDAAR